MTHQIELIDWKQLNDGQVAVLARCCGDAFAQSWHTMDASVVVDDAARQASIDTHIQHVATLHETTRQAITKLPGIVGSKVSITLPVPGATATTV